MVGDSVLFRKSDRSCDRGTYRRTAECEEVITPCNNELCGNGLCKLFAVPRTPIYNYRLVPKPCCQSPVHPVLRVPFTHCSSLIDPRTQPTIHGYQSISFSKPRTPLKHPVTRRCSPRRSNIICSYGQFPPPPQRSWHH